MGILLPEPEPATRDSNELKMSNTDLLSGHLFFYYRNSTSSCEKNSLEGYPIFIRHFEIMKKNVYYSNMSMQ